MKDPKWLAIARKYVGVREIPGKRHAKAILTWWLAVANWIKDDETPWCGAFVAGVLKEAGYPVQKGGASARKWLKFGKVLNEPCVGCIVIFWRGKRLGWSGHVGFVVGKDRFGNLMVLGGNQNDQVCIRPFSTNRVLGYRWPSIWPFKERFSLPIIDSNGKVSTNEA